MSISIGSILIRDSEIHEGGPGFRTAWHSLGRGSDLVTASSPSIIAFRVVMTCAGSSARASGSPHQKRHRVEGSTIRGAERKAMFSRDEDPAHTTAAGIQRPAVQDPARSFLAARRCKKDSLPVARNVRVDGKHCAVRRINDPRGGLGAQRRSVRRARCRG